MSGALVCYADRYRFIEFHSDENNYVYVSRFHLSSYMQFLKWVLA